MATPQMQVQANSIVLNPLSPGSVIIKTFNPDGSVLNVSSGFTLFEFNVGAQSARNEFCPAIDLSSDVTPTFSATGVTLTWTGAQANTMSLQLASNNSQYVIALSNDSGTTRSLLAAGTITTNNYDGLLT